MEYTPTYTEAQLEAERDSYKEFYTTFVDLQEQLLFPQTVYYHNLQPTIEEMRHLAQLKVESLGEILENKGIEISNQVRSGLQVIQTRYGTLYAILDNLLRHIEIRTGQVRPQSSFGAADF